MLDGVKTYTEEGLKGTSEQYMEIVEKTSIFTIIWTQTVPSARMQKCKGHKFTFNDTKVV